MEVGVFDDTKLATLTLFRKMVDSASTWIPFSTILLLTNVCCNTRGTRNYLLVQSSSFVEVNPLFPDAEWLRGFAIKSRNESLVNPPFPSSSGWISAHNFLTPVLKSPVFDFDTAIIAPARTLFTIADIEDLYCLSQLVVSAH